MTVGDNPARVPTLRDRIEALLRGSEPGVEPEIPWAASLTPEQVASIRQAVPQSLARAAVLVPLVERPEGLHVLLTLRASHLKHHAGQVSFPGGRLEPGDAGPWEAALREAQEEIGLEPRFVSRVGYLRDHIVITGFRVTPVVGFVQPGFTLRLDTKEVEDVFEVPLDFVLDPVNHLPRDRQFAGFTVSTYEIPYQGRHIWGATASMLLTLSALVQGSVP
ncbi:MAG TPA: CoA pyrophosphatase [Steroidobacteraceae bacterium]|nr:CoA pyrophosphatase [Steroidobacteraceae bacterium]